MSLFYLNFIHVKYVLHFNYCSFFICVLVKIVRVVIIYRFNYVSHRSFFIPRLGLLPATAQLAISMHARTQQLSAQ